MTEGYRLQFTTIPIQTSYIPRSMSESASTVTTRKIKELMHNAALIVVQPSPDQYISHIFPVPKKTPGEYRIIFDLSTLNKFIRKITFRMDNYHTIMTQISRGDFFHFY